MAKKNTKKTETKEVTVDLTQLTKINDKYLQDLIEFLLEKIEDLKTSREGNSLIITVEKTFSRRKIKDYLKKFLFLADLNEKYRPIALAGDKKGYEIHERRSPE
ncbi:MAG: hypothetical protein ACTSWY_15210 [Promethearchaeota archaeon]